MSRRRHTVPSSERRTQILQAATELFARKGFNGTTTREIAERVGVEETILFRLFPTKRDLYWAVIDAKTEHLSEQERLQTQLSSEQDERKIFTAIAENILERNTNDSTLTRLLLFSGLEEHELSQRFFQTYIASYYEVLAGYIRRRVRQGAYRKVDPLLSARGFLGMVFNYFLVQELFAGRPHRFDVQKVSETLTDIWLNGMLKK
ncbi:MAG TPA: TetR/AcrR family transcriptional regulator [Verrucomicrobiae bacterium]|nr:TetR/AcrR family transcriptional regulator [Verrucomicrobiae bacterium]